MKTTIFAIICFVFLAIFLSCNQRKAQGTKEEMTEEMTEKNMEKPETPPVAESYQAVGFRKSACFGQCPAYEVKFFTDNTATWHGMSHVERMGWHEAKLAENTIKDIRNKAHELSLIHI